MKRALRLAQRGHAHAAPNPMVGCVVVNKGKIVGEGYHAFFGGPHAEVEALKKAGSKARGATMYINLEPCTHWGKTPPCAPRIAQSGVHSVFIAMNDPNPQVQGRGTQYLKRKGIKVTTGLGSEAARSLNRPFRVWIKEHRPYIIAKMAMSLDGKIATSTGDSKWISCEESRNLVHQWRSSVDAVLIGATTAIKDNPLLTSHGMGKNPVRIVLDPKGRTPDRLNLYQDRSAPTWLVTHQRKSAPGSAQIVRNPLKRGQFELKKIVRNIFKNNVNQLLLEGGGETIWEFVQANLVDEFRFFISPRIVGGRLARTPVEGGGWDRIRHSLPLKNWTQTQIGSDLLITAWRD